MSQTSELTLFNILMVEDSPTDVMLTREALQYAKARVNLMVVEDGVEAMKFLRREDAYSSMLRPDMILLDLNLPRKNGLEALKEIKSDDMLKNIPIAIFTTSNAETDVSEAYAHHANCFITKPVDFEAFDEVIRSIQSFWLSVVTFQPAQPS